MESITDNFSSLKYYFFLQTASSELHANVTLFHPDHLGSTNLMTDDDGAIVRTTKYLPYGGSYSDSGSIDNAHKYTGQISDDSTGLYYYGARYYDPQLGKIAHLG